MTRPDDIEPWAMKAAIRACRLPISIDTDKAHGIYHSIARALMAAKAKQRIEDVRTLRRMAQSKADLGLEYQDNTPQKLALFAEASALVEALKAIRDGSV